MRVRFAPSPTGQLHVGNARTALFNWLLARGSGGVFILRIEDTNAERSTRESEVAIERDLRWLGLDWDEGPDIGGPRGPYRQSERLHLYQSYATELLNTDAAYYCFCSAADLEAAREAAVASGRPARYGGACRRLSREQAQARIAAGERPAIRFRVPAVGDVVFTDVVRGDVRFPIDVIGDPIIVRADGHPAYNFAVVVDDALMEVTHVVRGEDHISNTPRQVLLYEALGFSPPMFAHLALVMGPDHGPLSKRHGATSVAEFRSKGYLPESLVNYLALIGWSPRGPGRSRSVEDDAELWPIDELAKRFALDDVSHSAGVFDEEKLAWVNRHYLKIADPTRIAELSVPHFGAAGVRMAPDGRGLAFLAGALPMATSSVDRIDQIPTRLAFLFDADTTHALLDPGVRSEMNDEGARAVVVALAEELTTAPRLDRQGFRAVANQVKARTGRKGKALFHPIRVALTGRREGPELDLAVPAIDAGADLPGEAGIPKILGCRERAALFARALEQPW
ncbi:MAG: glutamate--tRNA ligase [Acidobacteria bacterium RIFCSPLOWO2_12_FULL_65_11]|nr:MAG: glutamate--tRNA ligase [Acidobacteria bacterium RIFCSPLOWO2_02_FULL_64_15]OFW29886.1 MAG: glutamate--tRNA ligase [Acidobacteria bacterium RIFCSPLOWO2_12_FULL_65_11]